MSELPRKPVVFIAGPMTGYHNFNRDEFNAEARILEERGFTVLNPAILPDGLQHEQYLQITLSMLEQADGVFLLNGWKRVPALPESLIAPVSWACCSFTRAGKVCRLRSTVSFTH